jgi:hypothetical protein
MIAKLGLNRLLWAVTGGLAVVAAIAGILDPHHRYSRPEQERCSDFVTVGVNSANLDSVPMSGTR